MKRSQKNQQKKLPKFLEGSFSGQVLCELPAVAEGEEAQEPGLPKLKINAYNGQAMKANLPEPLIIDLAGVKASEATPVLRQHDPQQIVGHGSVSVNAEGISLDGIASGPDAGPVVEAAKNGFPWQASVGMDILKAEAVAAKKSVTVNGNEFTGPGYVLRATRLREVSVVPAGADHTTSAVAAEAPQEEKEEREIEMTAAEFSSNPFAETEAKAKHKNALKAELKAAVERGQMTADEALETFTEALEAGLRPESLRLQLIEDNRLDAAGIVTNRQQRRSQADDLLVAQRAFEQGLGIELPDDEVTAKADSEYHGNGCSLVEFFQVVARANGYRSRSFAPTPEMLAYALPRLEARGPSTYDLAGVLSNIANKMLRDAFNYVEDTYSRVALNSRTSDFKEMTTYSLTGDQEYLKLPPGGEIKHATMGEREYKNKADTYARLFAIDRQDFINDDLSAFTRVRTKLGRGAALSLNKHFWTEFLANISTWWSAGNGNLLSPDTALSSEGLAAGERLFLEQVDYDGNPMGSSPQILLTTAKDLYLGRELTQHPGRMIAGGTDRQATTTNQWQGRFQLEASRYLGTSQGLPNASDDHWFLLADPMDMPTIEIVYLNGRRFPTIETVQADADILGVIMRGYHDWGVRKQEAKASIRSAGTTAPAAAMAPAAAASSALKKGK